MWILRRDFSATQEGYCRALGAGLIFGHYTGYPNDNLHDEKRHNHFTLHFLSMSPLTAKNFYLGRVPATQFCNLGNWGNDDKSQIRPLQIQNRPLTLKIGQYRQLSVRREEMQCERIRKLISRWHRDELGAERKATRRKCSKALAPILDIIRKNAVHASLKADASRQCPA